MSSTTQHLRLALTGTSSEDKNILFETWRTQMSGEDATSNMQIIDAAIAEDRERLSALEAKEDPVTEVNGKTGKVELNANDVNARPDDWVPSISDIDGLQEAIDNGGNVKSVNGVDADENGDIVLTARIVGALSVNKEGAVHGTPVPVNADTLGGIEASHYALKTDLSENGGYVVPSGGSAGQVLAKASGRDFDMEWVDALTGGSDPDTTVDADTLGGQTLEQVRSDINASMLAGMTLDQIKNLILSEVVYQ